MTVIAPGATTPTGLDLVVARQLIVDRPRAWFSLRIGDRALVEWGARIEAGDPLLERVRNPALLEVAGTPPDDLRPGDRWTPSLAPAGRTLRRTGPAAGPGELLYRVAGRWRVVGGDQTDRVDAPAAGRVREVRPGVGIGLDLAGRAIRGTTMVGVAARGRLEIAIGGRGELRPGALDVGRAGSILVVGSRVDAETLTRARAMGVRGIVVAALPGKELRDFDASERRQRAGLHRLPPFAVLVLDGILRRPISSAHMAIFSALAGRDVAILEDPPALVVDDRSIVLPRPLPGWVRLRHGPGAGREGRWAGPAGLRRFEAGAHLEAGIVRFGDGVPVVVPLADLERFD
jgi:hypothetical protein